MHPVRHIAFTNELRFAKPREEVFEAERPVLTRLPYALPSMMKKNARIGTTIILTAVPSPVANCRKASPVSDSAFFPSSSSRSCSHSPSLSRIGLSQAGKGSPPSGSLRSASGIRRLAVEAFITGALESALRSRGLRTARRFRVTVLCARVTVPALGVRVLPARTAVAAATRARPPAHPPR